MLDKKQGRPPKAYKTEIMGYRINKELKRKFADLCQDKGYVPQRKLELIIEEWIKKESE
jgi:hypothetical protein